VVKTDRSDGKRRVSDIFDGLSRIFDFDDPRVSIPRSLPDDLQEKIFWKNGAALSGLEAPVQ